jgi:hypothetical protein
MLHMSYGKCTLFNVLQEEVDGQAQGGVVRFPFKFTSGIMRGRFSPKDGQLYVSGLNVWQSDASKFGCLYRVRYTGKPVTMPIACVRARQGCRSPSPEHSTRRAPPTREFQRRALELCVDATLRLR